MNQITVSNTNNNTVTMSSLEIVDFINSQRGASEAELAHADFLKKVPKVIGGGIGKFSATYTHPQNGQTYPCYNFPKVLGEDAHSFLGTVFTLMILGR
jgi:hypothetical protein